jgi:hypothetical protein
VADNQNPTIAHLQVIHTYPILFSGRSDPIPVERKARFNPGIFIRYHRVDGKGYFQLVNCENQKGCQFKFQVVISGIIQNL